jgi:hypothetical protein
MRRMLFIVGVLIAAQAFAEEPPPPRLVGVVPGDSGVYVDIEKRDEDVQRNIRYCVYVSEKTGGPYDQVARFWAELYKGCPSPAILCTPIGWLGQQASPPKWGI